jgi:hypothetical protein
VRSLIEPSAIYDRRFRGGRCHDHIAPRDRIAGVLSAMYSFGQDRVVGVQSDNVVTAVQWREASAPRPVYFQ